MILKCIINEPLSFQKLSWLMDRIKKNYWVRNYSTRVAGTMIGTGGWFSW